MSDYATYNFADHRSGDTFNGKTFTFTAHPSGSLTQVELKTIRGEKLSLTITNANDWIFAIDPQVISWPVGMVSYGIKTTSSTGIVKTFIRGTWQIL